MAHTVSGTELSLKMSNNSDKVELHGMEKAFGDAKGDEDLLKNAFGDELGVYPGIGDDNTTNPKDNNLDGSLLDQGFEHTSNTVIMMTPMSTTNHIKREIQANAGERSPKRQQSWHSEQIRAASGSPVSPAQISRPNPANGLPHALSNGHQHFRNPSNLRHQFNPNNLHRTSSPSFSTYSSVPYSAPANQSLNPFHYYGAPNMFSPVPQPFDESNLRSPVNQLYGTSMPNQANSQVYPVYSHPHNYSPNAQFRSPLGNVNTHYGRPRTPPRILNLGEFQHSPDTDGSGPSIRRRVPTQDSPKPQVKQEDSTRKRQRKATTSIASEDDEDEKDDMQLPASVPETDAPLIRRLIAAMTDGTAAEDNEGMKKTWLKIRTTKAQRVQERAIQMLRLCREAQNGYVSDKKAINHYASVKHRFDELCNAVRTQKTICKHLLEEEYSRTVANDPTYAATRVKNNRRVNDQKKIAIEVGRRQMGQQGHGKGRKVEQIAFFEEEENSADDPFSDEEESFPPVKNKPDTPRRKKSKKNNHSDDDFEVVTRTTPSSRKARRENRSARKAGTHGISSGSPVATRVTRQKKTDQTQVQPMHSSPSSQRSQLDHYSGHYHGYSLNDNSHHPTMQHSLPQMVEEHSFGHPHGYHLDPYSHHNVYSPVAEPIYSDDIQGSGETDAEGFCDSNFDIFGPPP